MKRDLDLVRKILFIMEAEEKNYLISSIAPVRVDGFSEEQVKYHLKIMEQANILYLDKNETRFGMQYLENTYYSISWQGHEFLSAIRDDTVWNDVKKKAGKIGGFLYASIEKILAEMAKQAIHEMVTPH